jgi:hypothetical protein
MQKGGIVMVSRYEWIKRLSSADNLHMVQEELDYWISEGGSLTVLAEKIDLRIDLHVEGAGMWKHLPEQAMNHVRYLDMFFGAKQELMDITRMVEEGVEE